MRLVHWRQWTRTSSLIAIAVGAVVGLASGAFGKGGSALGDSPPRRIRHPAHHRRRLAAPRDDPRNCDRRTRAYARAGMFDWRVVRIGIIVGLPLTAAGALLTRLGTG